MTLPLNGLPIAEQSAIEFANSLVALSLVTHKELPAILNAFALESDGSQSASSLLVYLNNNGKITQFQADRLLDGDTERLRIGPYRIEDVIGPGSLGTLYRAIHREELSCFAILVLPLRSMWNAHLAKRQVEVYAALPANPGIVPFADIDTANGVHYLAWPYQDAETLDQSVQKAGPLPVATACRILADIAGTLHVCHAHNLAHGVLRPSCIQLPCHGSPRLLELGLGNILAENIVTEDSFLDTISTANATSISIDCTAPETIQDPSQRHPVSDQYSLGCIAYFAITGNYPFPQGTVVDKMIAHTTAKPRSIQEVNSQVSAELASVVDRLLAKAPLDRFASMEAVQEAFLLAAANMPEIESAETPPKVDTESSHNKGLNATLVSPKSQRQENFEESITFEIPEAQVETDDKLGRSRLRFNTDSGSKHRESSAKISAPTPIPSLPALPDNAIIPVVLRGRADVQKIHLNRSQGLAPSNFQIELPDPILWTNTKESSPELFQERTLPPAPVKAPLSGFTQWLKRLLFFWRPVTSTVQVSLFGPSRLIPGQSYKLQAYCHTPETFSSVRTLARAFHPDVDLMVSGYLDWPISLGETISLHLAIANAGISQPLIELRWQGQAIPKTFNVFVPWESPGGAAPAALSAGVHNVRAAGLPFHVEIASRFA